MTLRKTLSNALLLAPNRVFCRALDWPGRPVFYDIDRDCPELRSLERNYLSLKAEIDLRKQHHPAIPPYYDVDRYQERIAKSPPGGSKLARFLLGGHGTQSSTEPQALPQNCSVDRQRPESLSSVLLYS